jgi:hypothetical protein
MIVSLIEPRESDTEEDHDHGSNYYAVLLAS